MPEIIEPEIKFKNPIAIKKKAKPFPKAVAMGFTTKEPTNGGSILHENGDFKLRSGPQLPS